MYAYKFKNISLESNGKKNRIKIGLVERFEDGKYDKFISMREALELIPHFVFKEDDFDSVLSKKEEKCKSREQKLFDIVDNM